MGQGLLTFDSYPCALRHLLASTLRKAKWDTTIEKNNEYQCRFWDVSSQCIRLDISLYGDPKFNYQVTSVEFEQNSPYVTLKVRFEAAMIVSECEEAVRRTGFRINALVNSDQPNYEELRRLSEIQFANEEALREAQFKANEIPAWRHSAEVLLNTDTNKFYFHF